MFKKIFFLIALILPTSAFSLDVIADLSENSTPLINEEFRKINKKVSGFTGTCADGTALTVENGLIKSCS